eukprot:CAMPEP_0183771134 /NCGR_PEP_ID=MMETSP0739-20130205/31391_1 /TAXON_ID=385413 /ORGANISM="Thalassiosira miniscula, Strain CCMP1093" /LENGTH=86 /DNA_ID=CAMNT_0026011403 /DNA_START=153 /DNA_END=413 /DNA_ORIENTATION=-
MALYPCAAASSTTRCLFNTAPMAKRDLKNDSARMSSSCVGIEAMSPAAGPGTPLWLGAALEPVASVELAVMVETLKSRKASAMSSL